MIETLRRLLEPLRLRVDAMIARGALRGLQEGEAFGVQALKIEALRGETLPDVERIGEWGLLSVPPKGSDVVLVCPNGRALPLVIATEHRRKRLKDGQPGDAGIYDDRGQEATLRDDGMRVRATAGDWQIEGDLTAVVGALASISAAGLDLTAKTDAKLKAGGLIEIGAGGEVKISGGGKVEIDGAGEVDIKGGGAVTIRGSAVTIDGGSVEITGLLTINGDPYLLHTHSGVESGTDDSGAVTIV